MPRKHRHKFSVKQVAAALELAGGIYTGAAEKLGCAPNTIRNYVERYPRLKRICDTVVDQHLDMAETKLLKAIDAENMTAIIFFLKTKGKHRGYSERHEVTAADGKPLISPAEVSTLSDEQLERLARGEPLSLAAAAGVGRAGEAEAEEETGTAH
jgi:hypothetical protein